MHRLLGFSDDLLRRMVDGTFHPGEVTHVHFSSNIRICLNCNEDGVKLACSGVFNGGSGADKFSAVLAF